MQTAYGKQSAIPAVLGQIDSPHEASVIIQCVVSATGTIAYGKPVEFDPGTQTKLVKEFDGTGIAQGVALFDDTKPQAVGGGSSYAVKDAVPILRRGRVWMLAAGQTVGSSHTQFAASLVLEAGTDPNGTAICLVDISVPTTLDTDT